MFDKPLEANADLHQEYLLIDTTEIFLCGIIGFHERRATQVTSVRIHAHLRDIVVPRFEVGFFLLRKLSREPL